MLINNNYYHFFASNNQKKYKNQQNIEYKKLPTLNQYNSRNYNLKIINYTPLER